MGQPKGSSKNLMQDAPSGGKNAAKQAAAIGSLIAVIGDEDTVTGMLLAGVGNVDARRTSNFLVVDSKTSVGQIEEAFIRFTKRSDVAVLLINQYIASQIRQTVESFVSVPAVCPGHVARASARQWASGRKIRISAPCSARSAHALRRRPHPLWTRQPHTCVAPLWY